MEQVLDIRQNTFIPVLTEIDGIKVIYRFSVNLGKHFKFIFIQNLIQLWIDWVRIRSPAHQKNVGTENEGKEGEKKHLALEYYYASGVHGDAEAPLTNQRFGKRRRVLERQGVYSLLYAQQHLTLTLRLGGKALKGGLFIYRSWALTATQMEVCFLFKQDTTGTHVGVLLSASLLQISLHFLCSKKVFPKTESGGEISLMEFWISVKQDGGSNLFPFYPKLKLKNLLQYLHRSPESFPLCVQGFFIPISVSLVSLLTIYNFHYLFYRDALDALGLKRYCCRRMLLAHVDLIEKLLNYAPLEK